MQEQIETKVKTLSADDLRKALRRAFSLGQTYWQQADSEYASQHRRADETQAKFMALIEETVGSLPLSSPEAIEALEYVKSYLEQRSDWPGTQLLIGDVTRAISRALGSP
jgi:hypothetical protein